MIGEDTGRDDDPRSRCSLIGSDVGVLHIISIHVMYYRGFPLGCYESDIG